MKRLFPRPLLFSLALGALTGCATAGSQVSAHDAVTEPEIIAEEIREADAQLDEESHSDIPLEINDEVRRWIDYFSIRDRLRFETFLSRGAYFKDSIEGILREHQVPAEMYYLAMIESGFVTHAKSRASAVGVWQFIRSTGRMYGLRQSQYLDERRDVLRATRSAARYLRDLHNEFGSWYLAMAAYNAGEGRIRGAIRRGRSRDFWILARRRVLPRETMNYVPKFLAAWIVGRRPERFGFQPSQAERFPAVEKAEVPGSVHLDEIARVTGVDSKILAEINPHLLWKITPPEGRTYPVWLPQGSSQSLSSAGVSLAVFAHPASLLPKRSLASVPGNGLHRVRRGETLESIARRYRLSLASLKRLNGLQSDRIYKGQSLKVQPSSS